MKYAYIYKVTFTGNSFAADAMLLHELCIAMAFSENAGNSMDRTKIERYAHRYWEGLEKHGFFSCRPTAVPMEIILDGTMTITKRVY